jgi:hypothetical protein
VPWASVHNALASYEEFTGALVRWTLDERWTAQTILCLYHWWREGYEKHRAHRAYREMGQMRVNGRVQLRPPTLIEEWCSRLPHVGIERAPLLARAFPTIDDLRDVSVEKLAQVVVGEQKRAGGVSDVRMGRKRAMEIWRAIPRRTEQ